MDRRGKRFAADRNHDARLMAVTPDLELGGELYMPTCYLREDILEAPFPFREGKVRVPDGPDLRVDVDRERLSRYTMESFG